METSSTLLESLKQSDPNDAWEQLDRIYRPMIRSWLRRTCQNHRISANSFDDITQEVLHQVARKITSFELNEQQGSFRKWLRLITINCLRNFSRKENRREGAVGGTEFAQLAGQLEAPGSSELQQWEQTHQESVLNYLLDRVKPLVEPVTWNAFFQTTLESISPQVVAENLNISIASVYTAKSRVLSKLRALGKGMLDEDAIL